MIEFGEPIQISSKYVSDFKAGGAAKRTAVADLLDTVHKALKDVTVTADNYEDLMVRLYIYI